MKTLRVLSLDGGGMRGLYTSTYLDCLAAAFAKRRGVPKLDIGKAFDLIVGTSTGAIVGCAIANGIPLDKVSELYRKHGEAIFPLPLPGPHFFPVGMDLRKRSEKLKEGEKALRAALESCFGSTTLGQMYKARNIALAVPCVEMEHHQSFVFKTAHLPGSMHRDDDYPLVDVCLASTAAPIYRSMAAVETPGHPDVFRVFVDGGLWANNPVLVGLVDALQLTAPGDRIDIFCMGTCPRPAGEFIDRSDLHRGLKEWKFGGDVATLAMDAQEFAYDKIAQLLAPHLDRKCNAMRFPRGDVPGEMMQYLELDDTRQEAARALVAQAHRDVEMTNSLSNNPNDYEGRLVSELFMEMPIL